jgi:hypothetical protein
LAVEASGMSVERAQRTLPDRSVTAWELIATMLAGLLFLIASVRFGGPVTADELDPAWRMVLTWASMHGLHWGSDIVFTYGPLGYLFPLAACDPAHYGAFVAAQIVLAATAAFLFANAWFAQRWPERLMLVAGVIFFAPALAADPVWLAVPVFALVGLHTHAAAGRQRMLWLLLVVAALYASVILLIKMSALLLILAWWLAGIAVLVRARLRRHAIAWLLLVPFSSLALWVLNGQRLGDLPSFIASVLDISRGYTAAMGRSPPLAYDLYGLIAVACSGGIGLWTAWRARHDLGRLACIALGACAIFVAWRAGFTRADMHVAIFGITAWLVLPLLAAKAPAPPTWLRAAGLGVALAVAPIVDWSFKTGASHGWRDQVLVSLSSVANNIRLLAQPLTYRPALEAALDQERIRLDLPLTRAIVGTRSVDLVGTQQGVVIINGFHYRPAPVFQGYGAYTSRLQQLNAGAYSGPERTDFVLLAYSPIDGNLPTSENALAFTTLYRNYHPVLVEKSYLLLEKDAASVSPPSVAEGGWKHATWGEWIDLPSPPDSVTILAARSELSLSGRTMATLLREPEQGIELELANGTTQRYRLGRGAAPGGFLVSPLVQSLDDYARLFVGSELPAVRRFRLLPQSDAMRFLFASDIQWHATPLPRRRRSEVPPAMRDAFFPGFSHPPQSSSGTVHTMETQGHRVLFMHSPSQLTFKPGAGTYSVSGEIGIVLNAFTSAGCERGDGVELEVSGAPGATLSFPYNPFADPALRPARRFELGPVKADPDGALFLDVAPGPANNSDCDWAYVRDVSIRAAAEADSAGDQQRPHSGEGRNPEPLRAH